MKTRLCVGVLAVSALLDVVRATQDTVPPSLVSLAISPGQVDVSNSAATITVTARITDNLSGNAGESYSSSPSQIRFRSPSGSQFVDALLSGTERVSGTARDGRYRYKMTIPKHAESGKWTIESVLLVDQVGNMKRENESFLAKRKLPRSFVVKPVLQVRCPDEVTASSVIVVLYMKSNVPVTLFEYRLKDPRRKNYGKWNVVKLVQRKKVQSYRYRLFLAKPGQWDFQVRAFDVSGKVSGVRSDRVVRLR